MSILQNILELNKAWLNLLKLDYLNFQTNLSQLQN
jgi:hypothetical protein